MCTKCVFKNAFMVWCKVQDGEYKIINVKCHVSTGSVQSWLVTPNRAGPQRSDECFKQHFSHDVDCYCRDKEYKIG